MGLEIERKFLLADDGWRGLAAGVRYRQGYIVSGQGRTVRVRTAGDQGYLTIKGPSQGSTRAEFEYPIPLADALELLDTLCDRPFIDKTRYRIPVAGLVWEVDEFHAENTGLVLAEVELDHPDQAVDLPDWIGTEVTGDPRYYNSYLVRSPFRSWD
jgi:adenylate cyclase